MDETASQYPKVLGCNWECSSYPDILSDHCLLPGCYCTSWFETWMLRLWNASNTQHVTYGQGQHKRLAQQI